MNTKNQVRGNRSQNSPRKQGKKPARRPTKIVRVWLPEDVLSLVDKVAIANRQSRDQLIEQACEKFLPEIERVTDGAKGFGHPEKRAGEGAAATNRARMTVCRSYLATARKFIEEVKASAPATDDRVLVIVGAVKTAQEYAERFLADPPPAAKRETVSPLPAARLEESREESQRRFAGMVDFDLHSFGGGELTDNAVLALLAEAIVAHEPALRDLALPDGVSSREECEAMVVFKIAGQVVRQARLIGWYCLNDDEYGDAGFKECVSVGLPGLTGRLAGLVRNASATLALFLHERRRSLVGEVIRKEPNIYRALDLAEALVVAEKEVHRNGGVTEIGAAGRNGTTAAMALAWELFAEAENLWRLDWSGSCEVAANDYLRTTAQEAGKAGGAR